VAEAIAADDRARDRLRIIFIPDFSVKSAQRIYPAADLFVVPSRYETFLIAAYEAAAAGLPVIATPVAGLEELVGNGEGGVIVERDPDSIADAMCALAADPARRASLGTTARRRAESFTWDRSVQKLLEIYDELDAQN
jgi:D-inositol-3-phosphate glycosyltransferase